MIFTSTKLRYIGAILFSMNEIHRLMMLFTIANEHDIV